jgi:cytochrome P450
LMKELFGRGIFAIDGHEWVVQRKAASISFRVTDIKRSMVVFNSVTDEVISVLRDEANCVVDMQTLMQNATLAAFTELSFGRRMANVSSAQSEFALHFQHLTDIIAQRIANPLWRWMPFLQSEQR